MKFRNSIAKFEPFFFIIFVIVNAIPVLSCVFFPTVDGPAHLYNANLIMEMLSNKSSILNQYFIFNSTIPPNIIGHIILTMLLFIFPSFVAEKIVLLIYIIGLPLALRHLFKSLKIENKFFIYLIFPFTYSFLFYYGSYNFNIAIVLMILVLSYITRIPTILSLKDLLKLFLFATLICLSHIFVFMIFMFFSMTIILCKQNDDEAINLKNIYKIIGNRLKSMLWFIITTVPSIIIIVIYLSSSAAVKSEPKFIPTNDIFSSIYHISPVISINFGKTTILATVLFFIILSLLIYQIITYILGVIKSKNNLVKNKTWIVISIILFTILFIVPDSVGVESGFIISRLIIFFFIAVIVGLSSQHYYMWFKSLIITVTIILNIFFIGSNFSATRDSCALANKIVLISEKIEPKSVVYTIVRTDNFLHGHISNYLGVDKEIIISDNYEAELNDFPLKWNCEQMPRLQISGIILEPFKKDCIESPNVNKKIDYIFVLFESENSNTKADLNNLLDTIDTEYELIYRDKNPTLELYKLKSN